MLGGEHASIPVYPSVPNPAATAPETFWRRRVVSPVVHQFTQGITPEKIALTLAVGSACALFPIIGTTTLLCLLVGVTLRLNQPVIQAVNLACLPLHLPVIIALFHLGNRIFGVHSHGLMRLVHEGIGSAWQQPRLFFHQFGDVVLHLAVAWAVIAPLWIGLVYLISLPVLREAHAIRERECARHTAVNI